MTDDPPPSMVITVRQDETGERHVEITTFLATRADLVAAAEALVERAADEVEGKGGAR